MKFKYRGEGLGGESRAPLELAGGWRIFHFHCFLFVFKAFFDFRRSAGTAIELCNDRE